MTKPKGKIIGDYDLETPCPLCGCLEGEVRESNMHKKLNCKGCGGYLKMLSKLEVGQIKPISAKADKKDDLAEINFKLDLIIDHLGIRV